MGGTAGSTKSDPIPRKPLDDAPISYHYLTFETELLPPPGHVFRRGNVSPYAHQAERMSELKDLVSPVDWSRARKTFTIWLSCIAALVATYTAGSYSSGASQYQAEWHISSNAVPVGIAIFTISFAVAPMVLAPLSELNGRRPVFVVSGIVLVLSQLGCAVTRSFAGMLVARAFAGASASTFSTMVGGVVSDIYRPEERNTAMTLFSGATFLGIGSGPLVSGFLAQGTSWRWIFYLQAISCGVVVLGIVLFFKETRRNVVLSRKAAVFNAWYEAKERAFFASSEDTLDDKDQFEEFQRIRWKVKEDEERASLLTMIQISLYRPLHLLFTEPVVFFFSLWASVSWAVLYLTFDVLPFVFSTNYGFNVQQTGLTFTAICVGAILATPLSIYQDKLARRYYPEKMSAPEGRLYFACIESALLPVGLFWFGWTSSQGIHWIVPTLAVGSATMGIFSVYLAVFSYLADTYGSYASSALAAQSCCRNVMAGVLSLVAHRMFVVMHFEGASSFLGGLSLLLTLVPWVLVLGGPRIRARSKFASDISG